MSTPPAGDVHTGPDIYNAWADWLYQDPTDDLVREGVTQAVTAWLDTHADDVLRVIRDTVREALQAQPDPTTPGSTR